jgi:hypothetical protein
MATEPGPMAEHVPVVLEIHNPGQSNISARRPVHKALIPESLGSIWQSERWRCLPMPHAFALMLCRDCG